MIRNVRVRVRVHTVRTEKSTQITQGVRIVNSKTSHMDLNSFSVTRVNRIISKYEFLLFSKRTLEVQQRIKSC